MEGFQGLASTARPVRRAECNEVAVRSVDPDGTVFRPGGGKDEHQHERKTSEADDGRRRVGGNRRRGEDHLRHHAADDPPDEDAVGDSWPASTPTHPHERDHRHRESSNEDDGVCS
jgi:hypothetical protein